jgi:hypothetical protein
MNLFFASKLFGDKAITSASGSKKKIIIFQNPKKKKKKINP